MVIIDSLFKIGKGIIYSNADCFRYQNLPINSINDAVVEYEKCVNSGISKKPEPPYIEDTVQTVQHDESRKSSDRRLDTCFQLIKLYCDCTYSFEDVVSPLSHTADQLDYRLR